MCESKAEGAKRAAKRAAQQEPDPLLDLVLSEADDIAYAAAAAWVDSAPDDLTRELRRAVTTQRMADHWGFDHGASLDEFIALFGEEVPAPDAAAGEIESVTITPPLVDGTWSPISGLALRWTGDGSEEHQRLFAWALGSWLLALATRWRFRDAPRHLYL